MGNSAASKGTVLTKKHYGIRACRAAVREVETRYVDYLSVNEDLTRELVSFQANKKEPFYRWLKLKEGFSSRLVPTCVKIFTTQDSDGQTHEKMGISVQEIIPILQGRARIAAEN